MKTSVKIKNLDGSKTVPGDLNSRHGTVNLARIGQRLAHVGPLERLRSIQRLGKLSLAQKNYFLKQRDFVENRKTNIKPAANFKTQTSNQSQS